MTPGPELMRRLARRRVQARAVLLFERVWPAVWPALGLLGSFLCLALLDLPRLLPPWPHILLLGAVTLATLGLLANGLRRVRAPDNAEGDRRLERASKLAHRPLAALSDRPAVPGSEALWQAHLARAAAQLRRLRVGVPRPGLAARDRRALRCGLLVALAAALVIAGPDAPSRLARAFAPGMPPSPGAPPPLLQAWITPPAYTGVAPIFLKAEGGAVSAPAGSHLTVSLTGGTGQPSLALAGRTEPFRALDATSFQADLDLTSGGRLAVLRRYREVAGWNLTVVADQPPTAAFTEPPGRAQSGLQLRIPWTTADDYGVVSLQAELRLRDRPDAPALVVTIPLSGTPKQAHGVTLPDLTAHPWAGLPVTIRLVARDAPGQQGVSETASLDLPERHFEHPIARALIAVRKMLALQPEDRIAAIRELDRLSNIPDAFGGDFGAFLNLRGIASLLFHDSAPGAVDQAQSRLWQLALHLEESGTERTARALEAARQALRDALDRDARGEHVDPKELDRLMQQLQQALQQHLQALAEQARREQSEMPFDPNAPHMDARDLDRMAQQMRDAARQGRMDEARRDMQELERMLEALRNARPEHGQARQAQRQRGRQQMGALQDMVQRQGGLLDRAQERSARPASPSDEAAGQDQKVQQALRRALGELAQQFGDLTGMVPPSLGEADAAMRDAGQALAQGRDGDAGAAEQRAIEALQKGGREMSQQMARQFGRQPGEGQSGGDQYGEQEGQGGDGQDGVLTEEGPDGQPQRAGPGQQQRRDARRDPLGRLLHEGTSGTDESNDVQVPEQMEQARSREIQDELRRRGADRDRPKQELDYIDRLLRQF